MNAGIAVDCHLALVLAAGELRSWLVIPRSRAYSYGVDSRGSKGTSRKFYTLRRSIYAITASKDFHTGSAILYHAFRLRTTPL